jgi:hypothetical protein
LLFTVSKVLDGELPAECRDPLASVELERRKIHIEKKNRVSTLLVSLAAWFRPHAQKLS